MTGLLQLLSDVIGWTYFLAWSSSFYPQVILNYRRQRVDGYSIDFCTLNVIAFACYAIYSTNFLWNDRIREQYRLRHDGQDNSVMPNDVAFALHAFGLSAITLSQTYYYPRAVGQKLSRFNLSVVAIFCILVTLDFARTYVGFEPGIDFLYHLSYFKLYVSFAKYVPQAFLNYTRQSTVGLSIEGILLDFSGGVLSLIQSLIIAHMGSDWSSVFGNPVKLGLSLLSIAFPSVFIFQHYVLYSNLDKSSEPAVVPEDERTPFLGGP